MEFKFPSGVDKLPYNKLGDKDDNLDNPKSVWIFPDIRETFPTIDPFKYYVTSGEAIQKTEKLISDIQEQLANLILFKKMLLEARGPSKYLEMTKCEDGVYNGNIVARKDPKKKKIEE